MKLEDLFPKNNLKRILQKDKKIRSLEDLINVRKLQRYKLGPQKGFGAAGPGRGEANP